MFEDFQLKDFQNSFPGERKKKRRRKEKEKGEISKSSKDKKIFHNFFFFRFYPMVRKLLREVYIYIGYKSIHKLKVLLRRAIGKLNLKI